MYCKIIFSFILFSLVSIGITSAQEGSLPDGIEGYYKNYNFASTASTQSERQVLAGTDNMDDLPEEMDSERIISVKKALDSLGKFMQENQFNMPNGLDVKNTVEVDQEFFKLVQWKQAGEKYYVRTEVYTFDERTNSQFVAAYKDLDDMDPEPEDARVDMDKLKLGRQEIHEWEKQSGKWKKNKVNTILVDQ